MKQIRLLFASVLVDISFGHLSAADKPAAKLCTMTLEVAQGLVKSYQDYPFYLGDCEEIGLDRSIHMEAIAVVQKHNAKQKGNTSKTGTTQSPTSSAASSLATSSKQKKKLQTKTKK